METITRHLDDLLAFHAVATEGSFTKAAASLRSSKALVSKQVRRLEAALKVSLFQRTTRALSLTNEGQALLVYSQKVVGFSDEAGHRLRLMSEGGTGILRISAPVSFGEYFFPRIRPKLAEALPDIEFDFDLSNDNRDVARGTFDFAFRAAKVEDQNLIAKPLGYFRDVICASPEFIRNSPIDINFRTIAQAECLVHSHNAAWNRWTLAAEGKEFRFDVSGQTKTNQYSLMRELCIQGLGLARLPMYVAVDDLARGRLVEPLENYTCATHPVYLVFLRSEFSTLKQTTAKKVIMNWLSVNRSLFV